MHITRIVCLKFKASIFEKGLEALGFAIEQIEQSLQALPVI